MRPPKQACGDRRLCFCRWLTIISAALVCLAALLNLLGCGVGGGGVAPPRLGHAPWMQRAHSALEPSRRRTFSEIYGQDKWNVGALARDAATRAGPGSSLHYTAAARAFLGALIRNHSIATVADLSCNEMLWQPHIPGFTGLASFSGFDIVPAAIAAARANLSALSGGGGSALPGELVLEVRDMVTEPLPRAYDLVIVRDTFFHLPVTDTLAALSRIAASGSRLLATTTIDSDALRNTFILPGEWYPLNLRKPPFLFPEPLAEVLEGLPGTDYWGTKKLAVYRLPLESAPSEGG
jgi:hypothetical protein